MTLWTDDPNETFDNVCAHYNTTRHDVLSVSEAIIGEVGDESAGTLLMALMVVLVSLANNMTNREEALDTAVNIIDTCQQLHAAGLDPHVPSDAGDEPEGEHQEEQSEETARPDASDRAPARRQ